jgi:hypothetical protein
MLYTAKCFWPGAGESEIRRAAARASCDAVQRHARFRGALYVPADEIVLCLFEAPSSLWVKSECKSAAMPCERVMETLWIAPGHEGQPERSTR